MIDISKDIIENGLLINDVCFNYIDETQINLLGTLKIQLLDNIIEHDIRVVVSDKNCHEKTWKTLNKDGMKEALEPHLFNDIIVKYGDDGNIVGFDIHKHNSILNF